MRVHTEYERSRTIVARLTTTELTLVDKAAKKDRRTRSQFIVKSCLEKAKKILGDDR